MHQLRIGVNALYLIPGGVGGTEIYLRNLLQAMAALDRENRFYIFTNRETDLGLVPPAQNFIRLSQRVRGVVRPARLLWEQTALPAQARKLQLDCLFNPGFTAPALVPCPNVTVFHDLQHKRHPEHFRHLDLPAWNFFLWLSVKRSRMFVVGSESVKVDLQRYYGVPEERVRVALLGVEPEFFSIAEWRNAVEPMILCVSTLHPHKNLERLLNVFARFRENRPEFRLVLTGLRGFRTAAIEARIRELELTSSVTLTGWIPRSEVYDLYRRAMAFVYPTTFEGFGMPVVEAMAAGVPLACSDIQPLRSIVRDTAVLFDPLDEGAMLKALHAVVSGTARVDWARVRAHDFTWRGCAEQTLEAIHAAVSERQSRT